MKGDTMQLRETVLFRVPVDEAELTRLGEYQRHRDSIAIRFVTEILQHHVEWVVINGPGASQPGAYIVTVLKDNIRRYSLASCLSFQLLRPFMREFGISISTGGKSGEGWVASAPKAFVNGRQPRMEDAVAQLILLWSMEDDGVLARARTIAEQPETDG